MNAVWILILLIPVRGIVSGIDVETVATFRNEEACVAVAEKIRAIHLKERDTELYALCVPDILE